jgi:hypothetical protein
METYIFPVMKAKGMEYSRGEEDVNSNFKRAGQDIGLTPIKILYVYLKKHLDSIAYYVKTGQTKSNEPIQGRIGDAIDYLLILASLIEEESAEAPASPEFQDATTEQWRVGQPPMYESISGRILYQHCADAYECPEGAD